MTMGNLQPVNINPFFLEICLSLSLYLSLSLCLSLSLQEGYDRLGSENENNGQLYGAASGRIQLH